MDARTDPHRPSIMDPAEYVYVGASDQAEYWGETSYFEMDHDKLRSFGVATDNHDPHSPDQVPFYDATADGRPNYRCHHCGKHGSNIRYFVFFLHKPTKKVITVGQICAKRLDLGSRDELDLQRRAKQWRDEFEWLYQHGTEISYLEEYQRQRDDGGIYIEFLDSLYKYLNKNHRLTDNQLQALRRSNFYSPPWRRQERIDADRHKGEVTRAEDSPTEAQIKFIKRLCDDLDIDYYDFSSMTRKEASDLINELKAKLYEQRNPPPATEKQMSYINNLLDQVDMPLDRRRATREQFDAGLTKNQASRWIERLQEIVNE